MAAKLGLSVDGTNRLFAEIWCTSQLFCLLMNDLEFSVLRFALLRAGPLDSFAFAQSLRADSTAWGQDLFVLFPAFSLRSVWDESQTYRSQGRDWSCGCHSLFTFAGSV
jgi:hypothetical protein